MLPPLSGVVKEGEIGFVVDNSGGEEELFEFMLFGVVSNIRFTKGGAEFGPKGADYAGDCAL